MKGDIEIGYRMVEEVVRLFGTYANARQQMGLGKKQFIGGQMAVALISQRWQSYMTKVEMSCMY